MRGRWIKYGSHRVWPIHKIKSQSGVESTNRNQGYGWDSEKGGMD